jgi:hypothetical protein
VDFVVYGTGYGATLMLLGYALRTWGPKWRLADQDEGAYDHHEFHAARTSWTRFAEGLGAVIATCGAVLVLFTFALMLLNPGDDIGVMVCLIVSVAALIGVAVWAWMYFDRYGSLGVVRMPQPLTSYQPLRYDPNVRPAESAASESAPEQAREDHVETEDVETSESEEIDARAAKFTTHHPDGEMEVGTYRERGVTAPDDAEGAGAEDDAASDADAGEAVPGEAQADPVVESEEAEAEEVAAADEAVVEDGVSGDVGKPAVEATEGASDEDAPETPEAVAGDSIVEETIPVTAEEVGHDATGDEIVEPAPEVLPEAHEPDPEVEPTVAEVDAESERGPGGRDEALRRLRERRIQREGRGSDEPDDA